MMPPAASNGRDFQYSKLTRKKRSLVGSTQLWMGDGHILMVRSHRFTEEYRRFRLADIQAVVAFAEPPNWALRVIFSLLVVLSITAIAGSTSLGGRIISGIFALLFAALVAYDVLRGPRCRAKLLTEVSSESLDPVTRVSDYQRLMTQLTPRIEEAQGGHLEPASAPGLESRISEATTPFVRVSESFGSRYLQHFLYGMLLLNAGVYSAAYVWREEYSLGLAISIMFAEPVIAALLLFRGRHFGVNGVMKILLAVASTFIALDLISGIGQVTYMVYSIAEAGRQGAKPPVFWDLPGIMLLGRISITWRIAAGLTGLLALVIGGRKGKDSGTTSPGPAMEVTTSPDQPQQPQ